MRVAELVACHVKIPLKKTTRAASLTQSENDTLVVCCRLSDGTEGWGEGLPCENLTGETIDSAFAQLRKTDWRKELGVAVPDLPAAVRLCTEFKLADPGLAGKRDCFGNATHCAVELALLDAFCRKVGEPLSAITEAVSHTLAIRKLQSRVRYSGAWTPGFPPSTFRDLVDCCRMKIYGFHQGKVNVGVEGFDDAVSVGRLRRVMGASFDIRVDANAAWHCENLEKKLARLIPVGITAVEQPVPHAEVDGLAEIRPQLSVPIMLDESVCSLSDGRRAIERGTCDLFNIRLSKCGGFINSLKLAAMAHKAGLGYQLGCQVGETGILSAAGRHFACSIGGFRYLEGSFDRFLLRERLTVENLTFGFRGWAPELTGPGLGVQIDRAALQRVTFQEKRFPVS